LLDPRRLVRRVKQFPGYIASDRVHLPASRQGSGNNRKRG
jgi:hypothetical protein